MDSWSARAQGGAGTGLDPRVRPALVGPGAVPVRYSAARERDAEYR